VGLLATVVLVSATGGWRGDRARQLGRSPLTVPAVVLLAEALFATDWAAVNTDPAAMAVIAVVVASGPVALCWRRRAPVAAFAAVLVCFGTATVAYFADWPGALTHLPFLPPLVALYNVAARVRLRSALVALGIASTTVGPHVAAKVVQGAFGWPGPEAISFALFLELLLGLCTYGGHRALTHADEIDELEAERAAIVRDERSHVARELHDIVAHAVSIIVLQAAGARAVLDTDPARADEALRSIEASGRQAMGELRRLLTVLRDDEITPDAVSAVDHRRLAQLDELIDGVRAAGTPVTLSVRGAPASVDPSVEHAAYRAIQEALTNVCRYGDDAGAVVEIDWRDDLVIAVRNDRAPRPRPSTEDLSAGYGLIGLRERVAIIGGELRTADDDGRHLVHVRLPTDTGPTIPTADAARTDDADARRPAAVQAPADAPQPVAS
jgi:signal transduction histidine kinase